MWYQIRKTLFACVVVICFCSVSTADVFGFDATSSQRAKLAGDVANSATGNATNSSTGDATNSATGDVTTSATGYATTSSHGDKNLQLGDTFYYQRKYRKAIVSYLAAKTAFAESRDATGLEKCLNGLGGAYLHLKDFQSAAPIYEQQVECTKSQYGATSLQQLWAYLDLIRIYKKLNQQNEIDKIEGRVAQLLEYHLSKQNPPPSSRAEPIGTEQKRPLPMMVWQPKGQTPKAIIIAIHGLGLHCASFQKFAERMSAENFGVFAIDIRGFGSWAQARGSEQMDLIDSVDDLANIVKTLKQKSPETPVFILGESMGGAVALRYAAEYPGTVNGVIASVPADQRYKRKEEAVKVIINLIKHPNKLMSVTNVLSRTAAEDDIPKALVKFQVFMTQTAHKANQIKDCPILMLQGMKDRLVEPKSTIALYNNLKTNNRNLYLVGECEHLIFEEVQTPDVVFKSVLIWLDDAIGRN